MNKKRSEMSKADYIEAINELLKETPDMQMLDFIYALLYKCKPKDSEAALKLQEELEESERYKEESEASFKEWVNKHKASFELTDIPDRYCTGSEDLRIMMNHVLSQLEYKPSHEALNALYEIQTALFIYGFRRGQNYVNNQKKKATKGGNL